MSRSALLEVGLFSQRPASGTEGRFYFAVGGGSGDDAQRGLFYDTGTKWVAATPIVSPTQPSSPAVGDLWVDTGS